MSLKYEPSSHQVRIDDTAQPGFVALRLKNIGITFKGQVPPPSLSNSGQTQNLFKIHCQSLDTILVKILVKPLTQRRAVLVKRDAREGER